MKIQILSLFPNYFTSPLKEALLAKALKEKILEVSIINPRDFSDSKTLRVDDYPFGGGDSMILGYKPFAKSLKSLKQKGHVVFLSPRARLWNAKKAKSYVEKHKTLTLLCGRYGGIDQRFIEEFVDEEVSVGDFVLNGGEAAALILIESLFRFLPQALGNKISAQKESFEEDGLLEAPQWTRPQHLQGHKIPQVLLSGHHKEIEQFKKDCSLLITASRRPDLFPKALKAQLKQAQKNLSKLDAEELKAIGLSQEDLLKTF